MVEGAADLLSDGVGLPGQQRPQPGQYAGGYGRGHRTQPLQLCLADRLANGRQRRQHRIVVGNPVQLPVTVHYRAQVTPEDPVQPVASRPRWCLACGPAVPASPSGGLRKGNYRRCAPQPRESAPLLHADPGCLSRPRGCSGGQPGALHIAAGFGGSRPLRQVPAPESLRRELLGEGIEITG